MAPLWCRTATFFHLFFKGGAPVVYLFLSRWLPFVLVFVTCVLLLAADFWMTKNISGRLLVGLRWWNEVKEDGTNVWRFESKPPSRFVHPMDKMVFWSSLYAAPIVWGVFALQAFLSPQWLLIVCVAMVLSCANLYGYFKCEKDAKKKIISAISQRI
eukprot:TRINITY_DN66105_c12_g1_i2.p1 TRINITY_DN66105_c12_g1~~TRINITY_DN66105_c12_g1_i2.p1  ORF type:complete len:157 (-),score=68.33 TRINITY_DN66105_c12_g1_i2:34-504(-)